jgi:Protein kinase domain
MPKFIIDQAASWSRSSLASANPPTVPNFLAVIWQDQKTGWCYVSRIPHRALGQFTERDLEACPVWIPSAHYQPPWDPHVTRYGIDTSATDVELYCKTPRLIGYDGTVGLAVKLQREICVLEQLKQNPHPNICEYFGCKVDSSAGLVTGVYLKKYPWSLAALLQGRVPRGLVFCTRRYSSCYPGSNYSYRSKAPPKLDRDVLIRGIREGLCHLHGLGMAHNDLSPGNIMIDEFGNPIIIDFDNCAAFNQPCRAGTPDFTLYSNISSTENDLYAFERIIAAIDARIAQQFYQLQQQHYAQYYSNQSVSLPV